MCALFLDVLCVPQNANLDDFMLPKKVCSKTLMWPSTALFPAMCVFFFEKFALAKVIDDLLPELFASLICQLCPSALKKSWLHHYEKITTPTFAAASVKITHLLHQANK